MSLSFAEALNDIPRLFSTLALASALVIGVALYQYYAHPLSKYPGPFLWTISRFPHAWHAYRGSLSHKLVKIHNKYGHTVRVAPNELSFTSEDAWQDIYGRKPGKQDLYKDPTALPPVVKGRNGLGFVNDSNEHLRLRTVFNRAFSQKAIREQEPQITKHIDIFLERLGRCNCQVIDLTKWYDWLSMDMLGSFLLSDNWECLSGSELKETVAEFRPLVDLFLLKGIFKKVPPFDKVYSYLSRSEKLSATRATQQNFVATRLKERFGKDSGKDLVSNVKDHLSKHDNTELLEKQVSMDELRIIISQAALGGQITTANAFIWITIRLLENPEALQKLALLIRTSFQKQEEITIDSAKALPYLQAVIDEGFRNAPVSAGGSSPACRITPKEGAEIVGRFVPGNTLVSIPHWSANHLSANFYRAYKFVPERWLPLDPSSPYQNDRRGVNQQFGVGPRNCIAKGLVHSQLLVGLAKILWTFDFELCKESLDWSKQLERARGTLPPLLVIARPVDRINSCVPGA